MREAIEEIQRCNGGVGLGSQGDSCWMVVNEVDWSTCKTDDEVFRFDAAESIEVDQKSIENGTRSRQKSPRCY